MKTINFLKNPLFIGCFLGLAMFFSCEKEAEILEVQDPVVETPVIENPLIQKAIFTGYVQKGPFINGSSVLISELDTHLNQTGRVYSTRISDNSGNFEQKNIELVSQYVELKADGYYFDEVQGKTSPSQITLSALVDVSEINAANVNVLTHLEKPRVEYLVQEEQLSFAEAKQQAEKEILDIFNIALPEETVFESLDLTRNAALIAISSILQGYSKTADVTQLMADIIADIRTDGALDDAELGSKLATNAHWIVLPKIRENIEKKYADLKIEVEIPDFESVVTTFIENTAFEVKSLITYPATGIYGQNILADGVGDVLKADTEVSIRAEVPEGMSLRIVLKDGFWVRTPYDVSNWNIFAHPVDFDKPNPQNQQIDLDITVSGTASDAHFFPARGYDSPEKIMIGDTNRFYYQGYCFIEYYENGATTPTKVKKIKIEGKSKELSFESYVWIP